MKKVLTIHEGRRCVHQVRKERKLEKSTQTKIRRSRRNGENRQKQNRIHKSGQSCFNMLVVFAVAIIDLKKTATGINYERENSRKQYQKSLLIRSTRNDRFDSWSFWLWRHGVVVITTAKFHSTKPELRFYTGSNPTRGVSEICNGENLWRWSRLEIRRKRLSSVNHTTKTIHHHHHTRLFNPPGDENCQFHAISHALIALESTNPRSLLELMSRTTWKTTKMIVKDGYWNCSWECRLATTWDKCRKMVLRVTNQH